MGGAEYNSGYPYGNMRVDTSRGHKPLNTSAKKYLLRKSGKHPHSQHTYHKTHNRLAAHHHTNHLGRRILARPKPLLQSRHTLGQPYIVIPVNNAIHDRNRHHQCDNHQKHTDHIRTAAHLQKISRAAGYDHCCGHGRQNKHHQILNHSGYIDPRGSVTGTQCQDSDKPTCQTTDKSYTYKQQKTLSYRYIKFNHTKLFFLEFKIKITSK